MGFDYHFDWQQPAPDGFTMVVGHMRARSRGTVRLASADPDDQPVIDPRYLTESHDVEQLVAGIKISDRIVRTGIFDDLGGESETTALLALDRHGLERAVRDALGTYMHPVGTCRMGGDSEAVVDPQLRVAGVAGLRVADASVMPVIVSCNTNAACVMIGEKAADLIRGRSLRDHADNPARENVGTGSCLSKPAEPRSSQTDRSVPYLGMPGRVEPSPPGEA
jgi:choline dehydrogenase